MGLRVKFNLVLLICLLIGFMAIYWFYRNSVLLKTEMNLTQQAEITFQVTESIRAYNEDEVTPLINNTEEQFRPQTVGSYAASQVMSDVLKNIPTLHYKVAIEQSKVALYQPNIWQQNIIDQLKAEPNLPSLTSKVSDAGGRFLVYAKPIVNNNQVTGAKIIRINETDAIKSTQSDLLKFGATLVGILLLIMLILNLAMNSLILNPIKRMSIQTQKISQGQSDKDEIEVNGTDEISQIAMSFNRMQRSLKAAMGMLS